MTGNRAAMIRRYLMDNPGARTRDVARVFNAPPQAVSLEKRTLGIVTPRQREARKRRLQPVELDRKILAAVYAGGLVTAVLDDGK